MVEIDGWESVVHHQTTRPYWSELNDFVTAERRHTDVYPNGDCVFEALEQTPLAATKVVILGQDPYHGPGQANGLAFSVNAGVKVPPSLRNVFAEMASDLSLSAPLCGDLRPWARQGVLLLNTTLTVRGGVAGSHQGLGWTEFTDAVISAANSLPRRVVFVLWGASARSKVGHISIDRHVVIESAHPSPLSAYRGFFGSRPFSRVNAALVESGQDPVDWTLPSDSTLW